MYNKSEVRQQIIQYFRAVGSGENIVQAIKQALFLNEQFNPLLLFQRLSQGKQRLTKNDWRRYLLSKSIAFSEKQIRYFFRHNHFREEITLNEFLEAMIPYNADVLRQFKAKYLESLQIGDFDPEIEFIFAELMKNWIDFFRNLLEIRSELSSRVTRRQIQHLIKEDLVLKSKPRQSRKFHELFQQSTFTLSFHQLRKFLEIWLSQKQIIHQFYLLNVKRHIKCENPFQKIVHRSRNHRNAHRSRSISQSRSFSASRSISQPKESSSKKKRPSSTNRFLNNRSKEEATSLSPNIEKQSYVKRGAFKESKYEEFKKQLHDSLIKQKIGSGLKAPDFVTANNQNKKRTIDAAKERSNLNERDRGVGNEQGRRQYNERNGGKDEAAERGRPVLKPSQTQLLIKFWQQIILKQGRLERLRKQLAKKVDFNLTSLFKLIDIQKKGYINAEALNRFVGSPDVNYSHTVDFYGQEKGKLRLKQFTLIFRPLSKELNENLDSRVEQKHSTQFKKETMRLVLEIIQLENDMHQNLNKCRLAIKQEGVEARQLFGYMDEEGKGFITSENIKAVMEENNTNCEAKELKCLMKLLDKKIDERVSSQDFARFIDV